MFLIDEIINNLCLKHIRVSDNSIYQYDFLMSLKEKDYPKYLKKLYFIRNKKHLNLKNPKTLNEKIQWLKIYDNLPIKTFLTDKVLVRKRIAEKIGKEYLKPILGIYTNFDEINFDKMPERFVIKCNHGCKWQFIILDKNKFLNNSEYYKLVEDNINGWMSQSFFGWSDFETQYKNINPLILIEEFLRDENIYNDNARDFSIYCFNNIPRFCCEVKGLKKETYCFFDDKLNILPIKLKNREFKESTPVEETKKALELSKILSKDFKFARIDWYLYKDKLYFNEITFTPYSGYIPFEDEFVDINYGKMLNLKENTNG